MTIGKIEQRSLRQIWPQETRFTTWLEENISVLGEVLDLSLSNAERERDAGDFSVDLVAEDDSGGLVVIENQLEKSNHDHLGKLITYLRAIEAKTGIWIVADPRPEHIKAITWLNESGAASFYMVKMEAVQIGESPIAPLLTLIVGPSEEGLKVGKQKEQWAERHTIRFDFWSQLLDLAKKKTKLHACVAPRRWNWLGVSAGVRGLGYNYTLTKHAVVAECYIDRGKDADQENKGIFDQLYSKKRQVEQAFGEPLEWQRMDGQRACRICKRITLGGYRDDKAKWPKIHEAVIDAMIKLEKSLDPYIRKLRI